jgi:soluble lytic murein transglycosylase
MSIDGQNAGNQSKFRSLRLLRIFFALLIGLTAVGFGFRYYMLSAEQQTKIAQLESAMQSLKGAMQVDTARQYSIQKIIVIIDRFNAGMSSPDKYEIANEIYEMSLKYTNLNIDLICATITQESGKTWNPQVVSPAGALGLMQVMPATGMYVAQYETITWTSAENVLFNPIYNIRIGCRYLSSLIDFFDDTEAALAAYNGGERRASLWMKNDKADGILWDETQNYYPSVLKFAEEYRLMSL